MVLGMDICILICLTLIALSLAVLLYKSKKRIINMTSRFDGQNEILQQRLQEAIQEKIKIEGDLQSRTALLTDVSHEIRSRLHGIVTLSEFLSVNWDVIKESDRKEHTSIIFNASENLTKFMNDLLDYSKFDAGKMIFHFGKLNLVNSINDVINYCNKIYLFENKTSIKIKNEIVDEALIEGDRVRINQLFMNLFVNAIKYSEKGEITAELKQTNYDGKIYWEFILTDQGAGIPKSELEYIFEPFIQGTRNRTGKKLGSGLGLAMCKEIIKAHSGSIWAENNSEGAGAKFSFIIPALNPLL